MNYQIIKLVSGEELIAEISESTESTVKLENPMIFKTTTMLDRAGQPYDVTILKDWLLRSDTKNTHILRNMISATLTPNSKTVKLYELELKRSIEQSKVEDEIVNSEQLLKEMESFDQLLDSFNDFMNDLPFEKPRKRKKRKKQIPTNPVDDVKSMIPDELKERPMIYLSMIIPPEAIMNLVTSGILDPDQLLAMIEEVKKKEKFTGDEKKREDFGNKFSDWNPDPKSDDY
jgi:hypothetical protein